MFISYPVLFLLFLLFLIILFLSIYHYKKIAALRKLCRLSRSQRLSRLNELLFPYHLRYSDTQDTFFLHSSAQHLPYPFQSRFCQDYFLYHEDHTIRIRLLAVCDGFISAAMAEISTYDAKIPFEVCDLFPMSPLSPALQPYADISFREDHRKIFSRSGRKWRIAGFQICPQFIPSTLTVDFTFQDDSLLNAIAQVPGITVNGQTARLTQKAVSFIKPGNRLRTFLYPLITSPAFYTADRLLLWHDLKPQK